MFVFGTGSECLLCVSSRGLASFTASSDECFISFWPLACFVFSINVCLFVTGPVRCVLYIKTDKNKI